MKWIVFYYNMNSRQIERYNIFNHGGFRKGVEKLLEKYKTRDAFAEELQAELMYYFWCKSEWEIVISPWASNGDEIKVDIYHQVMNNWEPFVDYLWYHYNEVRL